MIHCRNVFGSPSMPFEIRLWNAVEIPAADFRPEVDVTCRFLDRLKTDTLVLDKLHRHLRYSPHDDVSAGYLRNRIVAVRRQPFRVERLSALVVQDMFEAMILQEPDGLFEFGGQPSVVPVDNRIDVFLEQNFE